MRFITEFIKHPIQTGSVIPSSRFLAQEIIKSAKLNNKKVIVELGPGVGTYSKYILDSRNQSSTYFAIEINSKFYELIQKKYQDIKIYNGDIYDIKKYLKKNNKISCDCIISGIPWTNFNTNVQQKLFTPVYESLDKNGVFLTFAYIHSPYLKTGKEFKKLLNKKFKKVEISKIIWKNFPPAIIYKCIK